MLVLKDHQSKTVLTRQSQSFGPLSRMEQYKSMLGDKHSACIMYQCIVERGLGRTFTHSA